MRFALALFLIAGPAQVALGQSRPLRTEVGIFAGAVDVRESLREKPLALGFRVGYRFARGFGIEGDVTDCPQNPSNNFGQTVVVAGPKVGGWIGPLSVLAKVRAGVIHMHGRAFIAHNGGARTEPAIDVGGIFELEMSRRLAIRIDTGTLIVPFGDRPVRGPLPPCVRELGTTRHRTGSFGMQFRF